MSDASIPADRDADETGRQGGSPPDDPFPVPLDLPQVVPPEVDLDQPATDPFGGEVTFFDKFPPPNTSITTYEEYERSVGRVPPPRWLREYVATYPNAAEIIWEGVRSETTMAHDEQSHRHELETAALTSGIELARKGQDRAFQLAILFLVSSVVVMVLGMLTDHAAVAVSGAALILAEIVAIATLLITGRAGSVSERITKERIRSGEPAEEPREPNKELGP